MVWALKSPSEVQGKSPGWGLGATAKRRRSTAGERMFKAV